MDLSVSLTDIQAAASRIDPYIIKTPVISNHALDERVGGKVLLKAENFQRTGSFKFRGACNRILKMTEEERQRGVVAWSSGNHAQGLAAAAALFGVAATIFIPEDAPRIKADRATSFGAKVLRFDRYQDDKAALTADYARTTGAIFVPAFDDVDIIAGQGTVGLELANWAEENHSPLDAVLVCCGGGGLTAGVAIALRALSPGTETFCVEPDKFDDHKRSLDAGRRVGVELGGKSICDSLLTPMPGAVTWPINQSLLSGGLTVTDAEVAEALRYAFVELKMVVEPGGAVGLAALLSGKLDARGKAMGVILSGGNTDADTLFGLVNGAVQD